LSSPEPTKGLNPIDAQLLIGEPSAVKFRKAVTVNMAIILDARFHSVLLRIDEQLAVEARARGCPHCGGKLHSAPYPRRPRGWPTEADGTATRLSFCCYVCRGRVTPPSVRYMGRRVYSAAAMLLWSAVGQRTRPGITTVLCNALEVPQRTLERRKDWWRSTFVESPFWQYARGMFMPLLDDSCLPGAMLERCRGRSHEARFVQTLCYLATGP